MDNDKLQQTRELYHFGAFRLDAAERRLWCEDELISLKPKQFDLLFYFVENAGRMMKKTELLDAVWADAFVEETTLARNVSWLRKLLENGANGERIIETIPKLGYRFTAEVTRSETDENAIIVEEEISHHFCDEEIITFSEVETIDERDATGDETWKENTDFFPQNNKSSVRSFFASNFLLIAVGFVVLVGSGFTIYGNYFKNQVRINSFDFRTPETIKNTTAGTKSKSQLGNISETSVDGENQSLNLPAVSEKAAIKIGSIIHLRNQSSSEAGYLDVWGLVKNKPEFSIVPTELMFVSTHPNPNRDNGSGSWEIVSATGKKEGEPLVYGDRIHLRNMYPDAGYLDNCGWIKDMPVFKNYRKVEKFAVFTSYSEDRDNGTGIWIVSSDTKFEGKPVLEEDGIALENGFPSGGFLNVSGRVNEISTFSDYDGSLLVFIHESSFGRRPNSGIWIISNSQIVPNSQ